MMDFVKPCIMVVTVDANKISEEIRKRIQVGNRCYHANKKLLADKLLNYNSKIQIYKTIIRPTVTYGSETWTLTMSDENQLRIFERKILRRIYGPTQNLDGTWRIKTNDELRVRMGQEDIIKFIKSQRLRWAAHVIRMEKTRNTRKITEWKPYKTRTVGRPRLRWMDQVEEDLRKMKIVNWRKKMEDRQVWNRIVEQTKTHPGL
jgi:hypothetical protein